MKINQIWEDLSRDKSQEIGLLYRRYSGSILPDVYVALQKPEGLLCIYLTIDSNIEINTSTFSNLQEIKVDVFTSSSNTSKNIIIFKLLNRDHKDIFAILCEDLISKISNESNEKKIIHEVLNRLEKWKSLFIKTKTDGLTPEEQRGLFGELYFLKMFLQSNIDYLYVLNSWVGTEKHIRDFQYGNWAVEVKTTHGNNHQKIQISNERQLDTSNIQSLFLYHISLELHQNSGDSLNDLIEDIVIILSSNIIALNKFKYKLLEAGYFASHKIYYDKNGFSVRKDTFYQIKNEFPRIEEKDIRIGIGDVKYSIILSNCSEFIFGKDEVLQLINSN